MTHVEVAIVVPTGKLLSFVFSSRESIEYILNQLQIFNFSYEDFIGMKSKTSLIHSKATQNICFLNFGFCSLE